MIRPAQRHEAQRLTEIGYRSKGHWRYPQSYFEIWRNELSLSADYIRDNHVFVFENDGDLAGYYALVQLSAAMELCGARLQTGFWLDHMFVEPRQMGRGIGAALFDHLRAEGQRLGIEVVHILSDPHARGFYEKMGCRYVTDYPSSIAKRATPYLQLRLPPAVPEARSRGGGHGPRQAKRPRSSSRSPL